MQSEGRNVHDTARHDGRLGLQSEILTRSHNIVLAIYVHRPPPSVLWIILRDKSDFTFLRQHFFPSLAETHTHTHSGIMPVIQIHFLFLTFLANARIMGQAVFFSIVLQKCLSHSVTNSGILFNVNKSPIHQHQNR